MRYLLMHTVDERAPEAFSPTPEFIAKMGGFIEEVTKAGVLLAADGVLPTDKGARVRHTATKTTVKDGPFTEAKEVIGGFAMLQVRSKEEAIEWATRFADLFGDLEVEVEVRQVAEFSDIEGA